MTRPDHYIVQTIFCPRLKRYQYRQVRKFRRCKVGKTKAGSWNKRGMGVTLADEVLAKRSA